MLRRWLLDKGYPETARNQFQERFKVADFEDCATLDGNLQKCAVDKFPRPPIRLEIDEWFVFQRGEQHTS